MAKKLTLSELIKKANPGRDEMLEQLKASPEIQEFAKEEMAKYTPIVYGQFYDNNKDQRAYCCHNPECKHMWVETAPQYSYRDSTVTCPKCGNTQNPISFGGTITNSEGKVIVREFNDEGYALITSFYLSISDDRNGVATEDCVIDGISNECIQGNNTYEIVVEAESVVSTTWGLRPDRYLDRNHHRQGRSWYGGNRDCYHPRNILAANHSDFSFMRDCWSSADYVKDENYHKLLNAVNEKYSTTYDDLTEALQKMHEVLNEKNSKISDAQQKKLSALESLKDFYKNYKSKKFTEADIVARASELDPSALGNLYSSLGNVNKYCVRCPHCGKVFYAETVDDGNNGNYNYSHYEDENNDNGKVTCPDCDTDIYVASMNRGITSSKNVTLKTFETLDGDDHDELLVRVFSVGMTFNSEDMSYNVNVVEKGKVFYTTKKIYVFKTYGRTEDFGINPNMDFESIRELDSIYDDWSYRSSVKQVYNSNEELKEIIPQTCLRYSGVLDAWGLGYNPLNEIEDVGNVGRNSYLYKWYKYPFLEKIVKSGLPELSRDIISNYGADYYAMPLYPEGKTLKEVLGLQNNGELKLAAELKLNVRQFREFDALYKIDNSMTADLYHEIVELENNGKFIEIAQNHGIAFQQIIEYIKTVNRYQRIPTREALITWADYLKMAKASGYIIKNKVKYPTSLKKAHDIVEYTYQAVSNPNTRKEFESRVEANYEKVKYSFEKLMVVVPQTPEDVVQEGKELHHCVSSYVESIAKGDTIVCFIREKENPDVPYFTAEVLDDVITQVEGDCRKLPDDPTLIQFIAKWAKFKNYKLDYRVRRD